MTNRHGEFIWYELMTPDIEGARAFYGAVLGWRIGAASDMPGMDYRMIQADDAMVGGVMPIDEAMAQDGARPLWLGYIGVDDVDAAVAAIRSAGGAIHMEPTDIAGAGRMAMASDPQGAPFYVMRGAVEDGTSTAFAPGRAGHCAWNELSTPDQPAAHAFYETVARWTSPEAMPLGETGSYRFLHAGDLRIGATVAQPAGPAQWRHYFVVPSIAAAQAAVTEGGGAILMGPHPVPGGDRILIATDPQGALFALTGPA
jgi:predicted enzyme related to lactoylglutathione lyase